jgi:hypothetical protein
VGGQDLQRILGIIDKGFLKGFFLQQEFKPAQYGVMMVHE